MNADLAGLRLARDISVVDLVCSPKKTAIAVLDLSRRCDSDGDVCHDLISGVRRFLDRARDSGVPILFTSSLHTRNTEEGGVAEHLGRAETEPVIYPNGYDKFISGELQEFLSGHGVSELILVGSQTNVCVMYTGTTASRVHKYQVIVPVDGTNAYSLDRYDYALYQLKMLPPTTSVPVAFSELDRITFE